MRCDGIQKLKVLKTTPFSNKNNAKDAFDKLFARYRNSIILVSYSSNCLPTLDEMVTMLSKYKTTVEVISIDYRYSFTNQGEKISDNKNEVQEYLLLGLLGRNVKRGFAFTTSSSVKSALPRLRDLIVLKTSVLEEGRLVV